MSSYWNLNRISVPLTFFQFFILEIKLSFPYLDLRSDLVEMVKKNNEPSTLIFLAFCRSHYKRVSEIWGSLKYFLPFRSLFDTKTLKVDMENSISVRPFQLNKVQSINFNVNYPYDLLETPAGFWKLGYHTTQQPQLELCLSFFWNILISQPSHIDGLGFSCDLVNFIEYRAQAIGLLLNCPGCKTFCVLSFCAYRSFFFY